MRWEDKSGVAAHVVAPIYRPDVEDKHGGHLHVPLAPAIETSQATNSKEQDQPELQRLAEASHDPTVLLPVGLNLQRELAVHRRHRPGTGDIHMAGEQVLTVEAAAGCGGLGFKHRAPR